MASAAIALFSGHTTATRSSPWIGCGSLIRFLTTGPDRAVRMRTKSSYLTDLDGWPTSLARRILRRTEHTHISQLVTQIRVCLSAQRERERERTTTNRMASQRENLG